MCVRARAQFSRNCTYVTAAMTPYFSMPSVSLAVRLLLLPASFPSLRVVCPAQHEGKGRPCPQTGQKYHHVLIVRRARERPARILFFLHRCALAVTRAGGHVTRSRRRGHEVAGDGDGGVQSGRRRGGGWRAAGGRARPERGRRRLAAGARARGLLYRLWQSSPEMRLGGGAPATVRDASGGGGGCAGMRGERVTTDMHRLDHGDRATPHHDVAWMACPLRVWGARGLLGLGHREGAPRSSGSCGLRSSPSPTSHSSSTPPLTCTQMILHASEHYPASLFRNCPACTHPVPACAVCLAPLFCPIS